MTNIIKHQKANKPRLIDRIKNYLEKEFFRTSMFPCPDVKNGCSDCPDNMTDCSCVANPDGSNAPYGINKQLVNWQMGGQGGVWIKCNRYKCFVCKTDRSTVVDVKCWHCEPEQKQLNGDTLRIQQ